ncbi:MAG TPA: glycosyltransferase [Planctomycetota bacterium]|nr:glycosyltransferase [Planctomycetota bacterium]
MRIVHILPALGIEASGPVYSVTRLCESLREEGAESQIAITDYVRGLSFPDYVKVFPLGFGPRSLCRSPRMARWLLTQAVQDRLDVIHSHGLWTMPNVYPGRARRRSNARLVVSPRGTLSPWSLNHHRIRKRIFWKLLQSQVLERADCLHATSEQEYRDIRALGFTQPICIIPNGIDIPPPRSSPPASPPLLLFLGRLHPKKGVDLLLQAWREVQDTFPDWRLVIAGPDNDGYLATLQALARSLNLQRIVFPGPLYGDEKLAAYREASLYVLPTHSENFGLTVAEALAAGTPVITTKGAPWAELVREHAGWWIEPTVQSLVDCLREALSLPVERLIEMGEKGRQWMERTYSWKTLARRTLSTYQWLLTGGPPPAWVRCS